MDLAKEESQEPKPKQTFTVYAYLPMFCEVEATDAAEATKLAVEQAQWIYGADGPLLDDIYDVVSDEEPPHQPIP